MTVQTPSSVDPLLVTVYARRRSASLLAHCAHEIAEHRIALTFTLIVVAATVVRLVNLGHDSLSHDEAWRANWSHHGNLNQIRWFAPGQLAVYWFIQHVIARTEFWVRLPDAVLGLATVVLTYTVAKPRLGKGSALAAAAFVAFHADTLFYSRVLKDFSFETVLTLLIVHLGAKATSDFNRRSILTFYAGAFAGLIFGFSPILVAAAWGPFLIVTAWRNQPQRSTNLKLLATLTAVLGVAVFAWYLWLDGAENRAATVEYFQIHEHAWLVAFTPASLVRWLITKSYGLWCFTSGYSVMLKPIHSALFAGVTLMASAGIGEVRRRWPTFFKYTFVLIAVNIALALLRQWPFGPYRSSLFLVPLFAMFVGCGFTRLANSLRSAPVTVGLACACFGVPAVQAARFAVFDPPETEHLRPILRRVEALQQPGDGFYAYYGASHGFEFYWPEKTEDVFIQHRRERGRFDLFSKQFDRMADTHHRMWFIFTHRYADERVQWTQHVLAGRRVVHRIGNEETFAYCVEPIQPQPERRNDNR